MGFLALMQRAIQDGDRNIAASLANARSGSDQSALSSARHFLRQDGNLLLRRIDVLFRGYLDRAMETMYVDLRQDLRKRSIDELTLIDDEAVNQQIEVGKLATRMREANEETIGRLNVIVGRLHGSRDARERENPFRSYLLARALYEAVRETAPDQARAGVLFAYLADALVPHLPGYYEAIRAVFDSSGVRGEFEAQRSRAAHNQRYYGAPPQAGAGSAPRVATGLQQLVDALHSLAPEAGGAKEPSLHDTIRKMLAPSKMSALASRKDSAANPLVVQLNRQQRAVAASLPGASATDEPAPAAAPRLSVLRSQLALDGVPATERMTVDVVALLFEIILDDAQIPEQTRRQLARLQVPVLKAAVLEPGLLHDELHPARQLLNRISSLVAGMDAATPAAQALATEIDSIVHRILTEFDTDTRVFAAGLRDLEAFLANHVTRDDGRAARAIEAVEAAERFSVVLANARTELVDVLRSLNVDKRISDILIHVWPHVLAHATLRDAEDGRPADDPASLYARYHALLPELAWSVREKPNAQERAALLRLLPEMIKRLRSALQLIRLPEEECKQVLDQLVMLHTGILRAAPDPGTQPAADLDELRRQFARVGVRWERASWALDEPPPVHDGVLEQMFAQRGIAPALRLGAGSAAASAADRALLAQTCLLGTRVELRAADGLQVPAHQIWISTHRSLYLFRQDQDGALVLYTCAGLRDALRDRALTLRAQAPVFERAVDSLLYDAAHMPAP